MPNQNIIRNFSRYAHFYDRYASVQNETGFFLLGWLKESNFKDILELGCGTGNFTRMLCDKFKPASLKALDISDKMLQVAKNKLQNEEIEFIHADAESFVPVEKFDLVTANACFNWFQDLEAGLIKYRNSLKQGGVVLFSFFGPQTFLELNTVLKSMFKDPCFEADNFKSCSEIKKLLTDNFNKVDVEEKIFQESLGGLDKLLERIKYTGTRGRGLGNNFVFSKGVLKKLEEMYLKTFGGIKVTYQVFLCRGQKE